jgi:hypothetical protein
MQRAAAAHTPDRTVMLNRIAAARARRTPRLRALQLAGAALAVAAVLGVGGFARWALAADHHAPTAGVVHALPSSPAAPTGSLSATPPSSNSPLSGPASGSGSGSGSPSSEPAGAVRGHPGDTKVEKGTLWSDGSVDPTNTAASARSVVTLKASASLTGLDLTIRVAVTPGLTAMGTVTASSGTASSGTASSGTASSGTASSGTGGDFSTTVTRTPEAVFYRFVLRPGVTLEAGTYTFTARYAHAAGRRDAGDDTYEAFATDVTHRSPHVYGNFYPVS